MKWHGLRITSSQHGHVLMSWRLYDGPQPLTKLIRTLCTSTGPTDRCSAASLYWLILALKGEEIVSFLSIKDGLPSDLLTLDYRPSYSSQDIASAPSNRDCYCNRPGNYPHHRSSPNAQRSDSSIDCTATWRCPRS